MRFALFATGCAVLYTVIGVAAGAPLWLAFGLTALVTAFMVLDRCGYLGRFGADWSDFEGDEE